MQKNGKNNKKINKKPNLSRFLNELKVKMLIYQGLWGE